MRYSPSIRAEEAELIATQVRMSVGQVDSRLLLADHESGSTPYGQN